jgi:beta-lactamase class A
MIPSRRTFNSAMLLAAGSSLLPRAALATPVASKAPQADSPAIQNWKEALRGGLAEIDADLGKRGGGRLGVSVEDTGNGASVALRGDERFPMCSTFKSLAAAAVLKRVEMQKENLQRRIPYTAKDLVPNSPVTEKHAGGEGLTLAELCAATIAVSDNTAANLILSTLGGPAGLTRYVRSLGDKVTRLDRIEPILNRAEPGDVRDTTTPLAMLGSLRALLLGDALSPASRTQLLEWMKATQTSGARLRAQLPPGWLLADKTGAGDRGTNNDVGLILPPARAPILVTVYLTNTKLALAQTNPVIAAVGGLIARVSQG